MIVSRKYLNELTYQVIGCAIEVHKHIGPGLLESIYERCFLRELELIGLAFINQVWLPVEYKGSVLDAELGLDVIGRRYSLRKIKSTAGPFADT